MKSFFFASTLFFFCTSLLQGQNIINYEELEYRDIYRKVSGYVSKDNDTIFIGDTLVIGEMSTDIGFQFITQGGARAGSQVSGHNAVIDRIKITRRSPGNPYVAYFGFKGWGMIPVFIAYEQAIESGEIINPNSKVLLKEDAVERLKDAKELFELGVISQTEYDSIRSILVPIIRSEME